MLDQRVLKLTPEFTSYTIAKMGLWAFTQTAARGLAPNVRVNAIGPGPTLSEAGQSDAAFRKSQAAAPLGYAADPDELCDALMFLVGASTVTGQMIAVDGGKHIDFPSSSTWCVREVLALCSARVAQMQLPGP